MVATMPSAMPNIRPVETPLYFSDANLSAIDATDPEVLVVGPAGTGKTFAVCAKINNLAWTYPGVRILMVRKTLESLKSGALATFIRHIKPQTALIHTFGGNKFFPAEFRYPNGSVILVSGMDKADKVLSAEFDVIFCNEATELSEADWETLKSRLRNGRMPYQQIIADCNPSGPRHWLNERCNRGQTRRIITTHKDNPAYWRNGDWTDVGRQYVQGTLASLTGIQRKRLFEGVWAAAEGLVYPEFDPEKHELSVHDDDLSSWRVVLGVDVGSRNPTAILTVHIAGDERIHVSHEVYRRNMTATEIVDAIVGRCNATGAEAVYIDPSAKGYIDDLTARGYPAKPAINDVLVGIQRVHGAFQTGLTIDPRCTELIGELGMYAYPANSRIETDKPEKEFDHALDALRYVCVSQTPPLEGKLVW